MDQLYSQNSYIKGAWGGPPNLIFIGILLFLGTGGTSTGGAVCLCVCFTKLFQNRFCDYLTLWYLPQRVVSEFLKKDLEWPGSFPDKKKLALHSGAQILN